MKAKLIKSLRIEGKAVRPVAGRVTLVDLDDKEFKRLEAMGVVAKPSSDDLKLAKPDVDDAAAEKAAAEKAAAEKAAAEKAAAEKAAAAKKTETKASASKTAGDDL